MITTLKIINFLTVLIIIYSGGALVGYPLTRYLDSNSRNRLLLAPPIGLALIGAICLPLFMHLPFTPAAVIISVLFIVTGTWVAGQKIRLPTPTATQHLSLSWILAAAFLSLAPTYAIAPHLFHGGISFGEPAFDHEKVAIIDAMVREGIPPRNPFFLRLVLLLCSATIMAGIFLQPRLRFLVVLMAGLRISHSLFLQPSSCLYLWGGAHYGSLAEWLLRGRYYPLA